MFDLKHITKRFYKFFLIKIILIFTSVNVFSQTKKIVAPDFTIVSTKYDTFNLYTEISKHKVIILDFFSQYCSTCQNNTYTLENIYQSYGGNGDSLWIWGIESEFASDSDVDTFKINYGATFPGFSTQEHNNDTVLQLFNISYTPYYYVVGYDSSMKSASISDIQSIIETYLGPPYNNKINTNKSNDFKIFLSYNKMIINCKNNYKTTKISLYDISGNKIYQTFKVFYYGKNTITLPYNLKSGFYIIEILNKNINLTKKLFIN